MNNDFDLERALAGEPVTSDGVEVHDLTHFKNLGKYCLIGEVQGCLQWWTLEGKSGRSRMLNLKMKPPAVCTLCGGNHPRLECPWAQRLLAIAETVEQRARDLELRLHNDPDIQRIIDDLYEQGRQLRDDAGADILAV